MTLTADDCLEFHTGDCSGPVEYCPAPPFGEKAWPRCQHHNDKRWERYENSETEKYAHSDCPPPGFDPSYAGERWDEDY